MDEETENVLELHNERKRRQEGENLLMALPQGEGSGLDADLLDGSHKDEIIAEAREGFVVRASGGGGGGGISQSVADDRYVNVSGDTMTGNLLMPYDDGLSHIGETAITRIDPDYATPSIRLSYDDTSYGGSIDNIFVLTNSSGALVIADSVTGYGLNIDGPTGAIQLLGSYGTSILFFADSTYNIGENTVRPATIYTDVLNLGSGVAGTHIVFRTDSQSDFGTTTARSRCVYTDTLNLGSGAAGEHLLLRTDDQSDIGNATRELRDIYVDGTAYIDSLRSDVDLDIDGAITVDTIDVAGAGAGAFQRAIPVTYSGGAGYIYIYNTA